MNDDQLSSSAFTAPVLVLVVDDVRAVRHITSRMLSEEGYRVFEAVNGIEALEVLDLARGRMDVVLLDVVMAELSGVDLARVILEKWPDQRVVYMSAHPAEVLVREGLQDTNVLFLPKPFTRQELVTMLRKAAARGRRKNGEQQSASQS